MANRSTKKRNTFPVALFLIFGLVGIGMLIGGFLFMRNSLRFRSIAVEVTGTISDIQSERNSDGDIRHRTYVDYSFNGQNFQDMPLGYYSSNMYVGKDVSLLVDPDDPGRITSRLGDTLGCILLLVMGLIFTAVGFGPLTVSLIGSSKAQKLMQTGKLLHATVDYIDLNQSVAYNGRHPYLIFCTYYDAYQDVTYRFKSKNLMRDPGYAPGDPIEVYVNPDDYSKYVVNAEPPANGKIIDYT